MTAVPWSHALFQTIVAAALSSHLMGDLRCCVYNPLSMVQAHRDQDCLDQLHSCHVVGIVGTNRKHDISIQQNRLGPFTRLQWSKGEAATGLELWVHRRYISPKHFRGHWSGEGDLQGRVGAARFKTPKLDILCMVAYLPPNNTRRALSEKICRWMCDVVAMQGHRCVPLVFLDHWQLPTQLQRTRTAHCCGSLRKDIFYVLAILFFLVAQPFIPIVGVTPLERTTSCCPKVCFPKLDPVQCGTEPGMHCSSLTVQPAETTGLWCSLFTSNCSTVTTLRSMCAGITTSFPVVCKEMELTSLSRQWKVHLNHQNNLGPQIR